MKLNVNGYSYTPKFSTFPGGEEYVQLPGKMPHDSGTVKLEVNIKSSTDLIRLLLLKNALDIKYPKATMNLIMPYLPYARQDRVCARGESHSLKVLTGLINAMNFDSVIICDCHSMAGELLLNNVTNVSQVSLIYYQQEARKLIDRCDALLAPDAGASKKVLAASTEFNKPTIQCLKNRNANGSVSVTLFGDIVGKNIVVLDDICDGGATFLALAQSVEPYEPASISLLVTHGIFSKGKEELFKHYKQVRALYDWTT